MTSSRAAAWALALVLGGLVAWGVVLAVDFGEGSAAAREAHAHPEKPGDAERMSARLEAGRSLDRGVSERVPTGARPADDRADTQQGAPPSAASSGDRLEPSVAASLRVRLMSSSGYAISGARAFAEVRGPNAERVRAQSDSSGVFALEGLAPGTWTVRAAAPAHGVAERGVFLPADGTTVELELVLEARPAVRIVVITPEGEPFPEAFGGKTLQLHTLATRERPERFLDEVVTGGAWHACSRFMHRRAVGLDARFLGLLEFTCDLPLEVHLALGLDVIESRHVAGPVDELVFTLDPREVADRIPTLTFRVVDERTGGLIEKAFPVLLEGLSDEMVLGSRNGIFETVVPAGPATLEVHAPGYERRELALLVPRAPRYDLGDVALAPVPTGEVVFQLDRLPVGKFLIHYEPESAYTGGVAPSLRFVRGAKALDVAIELPVGRWVVWCETWNDGETRFGAVHRVVDVAEGSQRHALEVLEKVNVVFRSPRGKRTIEVFETVLGISVQSPTAFGPGTLESELLPASYRASVTDEAGDLREIEFVVTAQGATVDLP